MILRAYETLSDDDTRKVYDKQLSDIGDLVNSASVGEDEFRNQNSDSPLGGGGRKRDGLSDKLDQDQTYFIIRILYMTFAIITFPNLTSMAQVRVQGLTTSPQSLRRLFK